MAKGRMLLKRISMSEKVNKQLSCDTARLLYTWILSHLDVNGCYYADPILVKNTIFPWREDISIAKIKQYLQEMRDCGLIVLYGPNDIYLHYPDFIEKQPKINADREGKSDIPAPTQEQLKSNSGVIPTQSKIREDKVREDKVKKGKPFIPPTLEEAKNFFVENGFTDESAEKAWKYYQEADWHNRDGKKVKYWKQTFRGVWFKDENKQGNNKITPFKSMSVSEHNAGVLGRALQRAGEL